jgi:NAD(P)-dependent dehydrogenase (short-subunit alcohol dehydrogenase family)
MPNQLNGRVAVVTGAGRGLGRAHALLFAAEGAKVVVNDLGGAEDGSGSDATPAQQVVDEIVAAGGEAVANYDDVSDFNAAKRMIDQAVETFGDLHVVVNNAGILRDRMIFNMSSDEWDDVVKVHLRGHFGPLRHAAAYWRDQSKVGKEAKRAVINTSSTSGLFNNPGQTNYGAAKTGIASLTIIADRELSRYGIRVNAIAPAAATRLTGLGRPPREAPQPDQWDPSDPANVSPFVAYLATENCPIHGRVFFVQGGGVYLFQPFTVVDRVEKDGRWTIEELAGEAAKFQDYKFDYGHSLGNRQD